MGLLTGQIKQVLRRLRRAPMFTAVTLITLAAGVGANVAVFSVLEGVLLKPLPYPRPDGLISVWYVAPAIGMKELLSSPSTYFIDRDQNRTLQDIGLFTGDDVNLTGSGEPERVRALDVTDGTLPLLGIAPQIGRWFTRQDDSPNGADTVMLTYGYWRHKFGGDPSIVGRSLTIDGKPHTVIGVLPQRFNFMDQDVPPLILPFKFDRTKTFLGNFSYRAIARLRPGVTIEQAGSDLARLMPVINQSFPAPKGFSLKLFEQANIQPSLRPLKQDVVGDVGATLWVLMGSIGLVLLIACANVANLLLVRAEGRQQELAIRAALGAGWGRIAGELLFESLMLGLMGSVVGLGFAYAALRALIAMAPSGLPRLAEIGVDGRVLLFTLAVAILASLLFGAVPVFKYGRAHLGTGLREGGRTLSQSREQHRARSVLVVVQVALALVLMICSGLMIRTFRALTRVQPGFTAPAEVQTLRLSIPTSEAKDNVQVVHMEQAIAQKIGLISGVRSVGISSTIPMDGSGSFDPVFAEDRTYAEGKIPPIERFKYVSPEFRATLGTPLVAGRDLTWSDVYDKLPVVLVSERMARAIWHSPEQALGKRVRVGTNDEWKEVIGVVGDVYDDGINQGPATSLYWPIMTAHFYGEDVHIQRDMSFAIRTPRAGSESFLGEVRQAVWSVDPNLPLADVHTLQYYYGESMARTSFTLIMLAVAGGMALLLGVVGLYGVIAYSVLQRRREIGIRMALGAKRQELTGMFVRHGLILTATGVAFGLIAAFAVMRLMTSLLFHVSPLDPVTYGAVAAGLVATAMLASYIPSRRAATVDPVQALRGE
jgi:predicted permease